MSSNVYVYTFFPIPRHGKPSRTLTNIKLLQQSQHKDKIIFLWKEASFSVSRTAKKQKKKEFIQFVCDLLAAFQDFEGECNANKNSRNIQDRISSLINPFSFCLYLSNLQFHCKSALLTSTYLEILANIINSTLPISCLPITKSLIATQKQASMKTVIISQQFVRLKFIETKDCFVLLKIFHTYPDWFRVRFMHFAKNALIPLVTVIYAFPLFDATEL